MNCRGQSRSISLVRLAGSASQRLSSAILEGSSQIEEQH